MFKRFTKLFKITLFLFSIFFLWNYGPFYFTKKEREYRKQKEEEQNAKEEYVPYVLEIRHAYFKKMKEKFGLIPSGYGGTLHRKVEMLSMDFTAYRRATIKEARGLQLIAMDQLVKAVNGHEKLGPFLITQPFSYNRVEICINFKGPHGDYCDGSITRIRNIDGFASNRENRNKLFYYAADPYRNENIKLFKESHDEALKTFIATEDEFNPYEHMATPLEVAADQFNASYVKEMKKNFHLECNSIGGKMPGMVEEIGANFTLVKHTSQEDARKLLLAVSGKLIESLNVSQELRPFLSEYPFLSNLLKLHIEFVQNNHFHYYDGSMVKITLENDKITYYKIIHVNDMIRTISFHEESYQEAESILKPEPHKKMMPSSILLTEAH
ncbi:MAG: hypothetical protein H0V82_02060 [Candidatus Protochlamydia sp.]|nr:hypothetical protein [Candidatus Protochlamydia sp.]